MRACLFDVVDGRDIRHETGQTNAQKASKEHLYILKEHRKAMGLVIKSCGNREIEAYQKLA